VFAAYSYCLTLLVYLFHFGLVTVDLLVSRVMTQRRKTQERSGGLRVVVQDTGRVKNRMSKNQTLNVANRVVKRQQTPIKSGKRISNAKVSRRALTLSERFSQIENKRRELSKSSLAAQVDFGIPYLFLCV